MYSDDSSPKSYQSLNIHKSSNTQQYNHLLMEQKMVDLLYYSQKLKEFTRTQTKFILTSRFNNETAETNNSYRLKHPNIGCIYCSPTKIASHIPFDSKIIILEMNNDINRIIGIGLINNHPICKGYRVYGNGNYNRNVFTGQYRISRDDMNFEENEVMRAFDVFCFKGNSHLKRGSGLSSFPIEILFRCNSVLNLTDYLLVMFKIRFQ